MAVEEARGWPDLQRFPDFVGRFVELVGGRGAPLVPGRWPVRNTAARSAGPPACQGPPQGTPGPVPIRRETNRLESAPSLHAGAAHRPRQPRTRGTRGQVAPTIHRSARHARSRASVLRPRRAGLARSRSSASSQRSLRLVFIFYTWPVACEYRDPPDRPEGDDDRWEPHGNRLQR
jgi:hypothetical protein